MRTLGGCLLDFANRWFNLPARTGTSSKSIYIVRIWFSLLHQGTFFARLRWHNGIRERKSDAARRNSVANCRVTELAAADAVCVGMVGTEREYASESENKAKVMQSAMDHHCERHRLPKLIDAGVSIAGLWRRLHKMLVNQDGELLNVRPLQSRIWAIAPSPQKQINYWGVGDIQWPDKGQNMQRVICHQVWLKNCSSFRWIYWTLVFSSKRMCFVI